jgi:hypothetical protein
MFCVNWSSYTFHIEEMLTLQKLILGVLGVFV